MSDLFSIHDVAITGLAAAGSVSGSDLVVINQGGVHKSATVAQVASGESAVTSVTASAPLSSSGGATPNITITSPLPVANGGTGSATQNFVDLTTGQTIAGVKTFSSAPIASGASLTSGTVPLTALAKTVSPVYVAAGTAAASTAHIVSDVVTASGTTTTVTLSGSAAFSSANYVLFIQDEAALGTLIVASAQAAGSFTFTSINTHVYQFTAIGV